MQTTKLSSSKRANVEVILLGFLVSLILKGTLDHVFSQDVENAENWVEFYRLFLRSHLLEFWVFLFALLRFMYGAYRFHDELPPETRPFAVFWNLILTVLLFISFYFTGLCVKEHVVTFYELFAFVHLIDVVWFAPLVQSARRRAGASWIFQRGFRPAERAAAWFIVLDVTTIVVSLFFFWRSGILAGQIRPTRSLNPLGLILIGIGAVDLIVNRHFYFSRAAPEMRRDTSPTPVSSLNLSGKRRCYLAGPLFTQGESQWNAHLARELGSRGIDVILPQEGARQMLDGAVEFNAEALFHSNIAAIDACTHVVAILDGADPDSGTCWECGYAYRIGRPVVGVRTDLRGGGDAPGASVNLMLWQSCNKIIQLPVKSRDDIAWIVDQLASALGADGGIAAPSA